MLDYEDKPKKKKKHSKQETAVKAKPIRNFKIIDDDIGLLNANEENEQLVDLLAGSDAPVIVTDIHQSEVKVVKKMDFFTDNKWIKVDVCENEDGDIVIPQTSGSKNLFKKRGEKKKTTANVSDNDSDSEIPRKKSNKKDSDSDMDIPRKKSGRKDSDSDMDIPRKKSGRKDSDSDMDIPRKKSGRKDSDSDMDIPRARKSSNKNNDSGSDMDIPRNKHVSKKYSDDDMSPSRASKLHDELVDETKCRVRKKSKLEQLKEEETKRKKEEKLMKYMEWGKGLVQKKERESQLEQDLYEAEKPMARYKNDRDLEEHLKKVEREDDPMAEYIRSKEDTLEPGSQKPKPKYRGPPAPPNRYGILPGARWDGVDRSNGFEKRFYESLNAKKARAEEAYKWSVEDM